MNRRSGDRVTLKEVAQLAGTSTSTVSLVINGKLSDRISPQTKAKVRAAVQELGYRPNVMARTLSTGASRMIGLVTDAIATTPFAGQIIQGAQDEAWKHGYVLMVANTDGNEQLEQQAIQQFMEYKVSGILYSSWYHHGITPPSQLTKTNAVLVNCFSELDDGPTAVVPDEFGGGYAATRMLIDRGHRRVAFVNTNAASPARTGRFAGYLKALEENRIVFDNDLIFEVDPVQEGGAGVAQAVLASGATGVCCHNDRVAMGLIDVLKERGHKVPDELSVVGFDDQQVIAAHTRPPLSTVALPHYALGAVGMRVLLSACGQCDDAPQVDRGRVLVPCPPVPRESIRDRRDQS